MESALQLSLEQEFSLTSFEQEFRKLDEEQKNEFLIEILYQLMIKNNIIQYLITYRGDSLLSQDGGIME